jgi:hypothetical protein
MKLVAVQLWVQTIVLGCFGIDFEWVAAFNGFYREA